MRVRGSLPLLVSALFVMPAAVSAQEKGRTGVTMGYPESVGVLWHVSDKMALRPEFSFAHTSTDSNLPFATDTSSTAVGVGLSALFYLSDRDNLRPYVAPRWSYAHSEPGALGSSLDANTIEGLVGAQYAVGKRFSVFGETGLSYVHSTGKADVGAAAITSHGNTIATHTAAGVILYF
jgi:hypothetical protein